MSSDQLTNYTSRADDYLYGGGSGSAPVIYGSTPTKAVQDAGPLLLLRRLGNLGFNSKAARDAKWLSTAARDEQLSVALGDGLYVTRGGNIKAIPTEKMLQLATAFAKALHPLSGEGTKLSRGEKVFLGDKVLKSFIH